ncbi:hypothetical protein BRADI_1g30222v3 [Brachypodium distachyon]|uniref:Uncharacterized protein n=1 Tax=Brachypodium distachyon TaxID=15368 RepID=A0A2K2DM09_BRADI|nr:hypothetical protein BRADI_1g30222v3 [Brachypodium distachyon]
MIHLVLIKYWHTKERDELVDNTASTGPQLTTMLMLAVTGITLISLGAMVARPW